MIILVNIDITFRLLNMIKLIWKHHPLYLKKASVVLIILKNKLVNHLILNVLTQTYNNLNAFVKNGDLKQGMVGTAEVTSITNYNNIRH